MVLFYQSIKPGSLQVEMINNVLPTAPVRRHLYENVCELLFFLRSICCKNKLYLYNINLKLLDTLDNLIDISFCSDKTIRQWQFKVS